MLTEKASFLKCSLYFKVIYDVILGITKDVIEMIKRNTGRMGVCTEKVMKSDSCFQVAEMN
jgi:hypothetical protein